MYDIYWLNKYYRLPKYEMKNFITQEITLCKTCVFYASVTSIIFVKLLILATFIETESQ